jgi:acyl CoA:acetate/3-ketoacid CoA transferase
LTKCSATGTYVDPRHGGGKLNGRTTRDAVSVLTLDGVSFISLLVNVILLLPSIIPILPAILTVAAGEDYLFYSRKELCPRLDVAIIRGMCYGSTLLRLNPNLLVGTTADLEGNISMEREVRFAFGLAYSFRMTGHDLGCPSNGVGRSCLKRACSLSGTLATYRCAFLSDARKVERVSRQPLPSRSVKIPGHLVDRISTLLAFRDRAWC